MAHNVFAGNQREQSRLVFNKALVAGTIRAFKSLEFQSASNRNYCIYILYTSQAFSLDFGYFCIYNRVMKKKRLGRPPKEDQLRNESLLVRVEPDEKEAFKNAADLSGISLSSWVRERLRRTAIKELQEAARPIAFLK
jgi:hypothetical protein